MDANEREKGESERERGMVRGAEKDGERKKRRGEEIERGFFNLSFKIIYIYKYISQKIIKKIIKVRNIF